MSVSSPRSPETRAKISAALKGRPLSDEHKASISKTKRERRFAHPVGEANHSWKGDDVSYESAHRRVRNMLGKAETHMCIVGCGNQARDWSYKEATGYSTDPADYEPRCRGCHLKRDRGSKNV